MSSFEFLSVLISVVIGLGIANLLTGLGRLLHQQRKARVSAVHLTWTAWLFLYMVIYWWTVVFGWQTWQQWNILLFLFVLSYGVLLYLLSVVLYPPDIPDPWDTDAHFLAMRHWFFGLFAATVLVELTDSYLKAHLEQFAVPYWLLMGSWFVLSIACWFSRNRRLHQVTAAYVIVSLVLWVIYQLRDLDWPTRG